MTLKKLPVLCPQLYDGSDMVVVNCTRCNGNWSSTLSVCQVYIGCEHLPLVPSAAVPECPISGRCQHQIQVLPGPCAVRSRGMVCESALRLAGDRSPENHPLGFHAMCVAQPDELFAMPMLNGFLTCINTVCTGELDFARASGDCRCADCGETYYDHPWCSNSALPDSVRSSSFQEYILHVLCDGRHVKL